MTFRWDEDCKDDDGTVYPGATKSAMVNTTTVPSLDMTNWHLMKRMTIVTAM